VGSENGQILDRAGERIPYVKTFFEAKRPAKFNLRIYEDTARDRAQEMSIVILPRDQRLNVFLDDARLTDYGPGGSSATSWNVLGREALVLRVGDVLETGVLVQRGETEQTPRRIICARLPFDPHGKFVHDHVKWKDY
jgi:hypothetical protein